MTLQTTDAFRVGLRLGLIDPITRRQCCANGCRSFDRNRSRRTVGGRGRLGENECRGKQQKQTSNVQRPTLNSKWKKKTPNPQLPTLNVQLWSPGRHLAFLSAVRMLAAKILISSSVSMSSGRTRFVGISSTRAT